VTEQEHHKLGDVLRTAREARGVDLARVERDTKIRARYLSALERGEYRELPGAVYTKGFLRNYGSYLHLDTDYLVDLYRLESAVASAERPTVQAPPRPIASRRGRAFVITPGAVLAALLTIGVALFIVYLVSEFVTFAGTPDLRVTEPAGDLSGYSGDEYTFRGVTEPNAHVTAETASRKTETDADAGGSFEVTVPLRPGANVVTLVANDPLTGRNSDLVSRTILVGEIVTPSPSGGGTIVLDAPVDAASVSSPVQLSGTAWPGASVTIGASLTAAAAPGFTVRTLAGQEVPPPTTPPSVPEPQTLTAGTDGAFSATLALAPGSWQLEVSADGVTDPLTRSITVTPPGGLSAVLTVDGGPSYLEIDQDQQPLANVSGRTAQPGTRLELAAQQALRIRVGNAAAVRLVVNGIDLGVMGGQGAVVEWRITAP
jgi:cytoskeletal protein RodZ